MFDLNEILRDVGTNTTNVMQGNSPLKIEESYFNKSKISDTKIKAKKSKKKASEKLTENKCLPDNKKSDKVSIIKNLKLFSLVNFNKSQEEAFFASMKEG